ncbi:MAG: PspA-associated protein PspAB [Chloroflexota bacterium]
MVRRFFDVMFGRSRPIKPKMDQLFALSTAYVTLTVELGLKPSERAGICFRPLASAAFEQLGTDLDRLLDIGARTTNTTVQQTKDNYGFKWVVLVDQQFEDLVSTIHVFSETLHEEGFGEQLLAAVFRFEEDGKPVYWIYNYKRGAFYPFVPQPGRTDRRDNAYELRLRAVMSRELPIEQDVERWYPLWGIPV